MIYTVKLLSVVVVGMLAGAILRKKEKEKEADWSRQFKWAANFQTAAVVFLVFILGIKIGADPEVVSAIGNIGLSALLVTAASMGGAVLFMHIARKLMKFDKEGVRNDD